MTLIEYLAEQQMRPNAFAAQLGVPASTVMRWLHGERKPTIYSLIKIEKATGGKTGVRDFFPKSHAADRPPSSGVSPDGNHLCLTDGRPSAR